MLNTPDFIEVGALLLVVAVVYRRPKFAFFFNMAVAAIVGTVMAFNWLAPKVPVSGSELVEGRTTMRAAIFQLGAGEHDVTVVEDVPIPEFLKETQLLLKVSAAGLNPSNFKLHKARIPFLRWLWVTSMPVVGYDVAGVVLSLGSDDSCSWAKVGDRVFGFTDGSMAEFAVVDCNRAALSPSTLSETQAAGLPVVASTSMNALDRGGAKDGSRVLVVGASGGCGIFGVTLAKARGAHVVGVCSTRNVDFVRQLGADEVVDYRSEEDMKRLQTFKFDVVYDTVTSLAEADPNYEPSLRPLLVEGGKYEAINGYTMDWLRGMADRLVDHFFGVRGYLQRRDYDLFLTTADHETLQHVATLFSEGVLKAAPMDSTFPLTAAGMDEAFSRMKSRRAVGKVVIAVDPAEWVDESRTEGATGQNTPQEGKEL